MNHWIIAPVVLPALLAPMLGFVMRHDITLARVFSVAGNVALVAIALGLTWIAADGEVHVYRLGAWPAPFGIVLVLDRLSAMMVLLTALLALIVLWHAIATDWDMRGRHFHALWQFQLMGISGAFLTGDAFNLFVFFEVLLIASYGLMIHSGGRVRLQAGLQYVVMNLAGSTLFLIALGTLYATTGTLNIADLAVKVQDMPLDDAGLLRVAAILLLIVFAIKAALFPVQFWLPATYANAPAPVAALFAIMTKVGAYAIIRLHTLIFGPGTPAVEGLITQWLYPAALITIAVGAFGVIGAKRLMSLLAYAVVGSMGTMMLAVAVFTPEATTAALYYLIHSTFSAAALFLLADLVVTRRGNDHLSAQPKTLQNGLFAALFFGGAIAMAGMPPLSGFLGKLLVMDALRGDWLVLSWVAILVGSLVTIVGFARAGSVIFWKAEQVTPPEGTGPVDALPPPPEAKFSEIAPTGVALAMLVALSAFAGPVTNYAQGATADLFNPAAYVDAVLDPDAPTKVFGKDHSDDYGAADKTDAPSNEGH
ncbi:monovalent cation/H+ antiporter subunit D [Tropicibacter naphthalenivorans]|uniref:Multiple resistance and pH homeostasis protein D n=1 Tax=Tropicibacter naphthalenivorans TaxID=441103 RepID=A0A0P1GGP9_9RHOB|nr:monovalent cation/H+ antiporter subunit D [Tropicibacter naphthalenivorans]CUH81071.1 Multiple resistance and pH homeostasis protein D [Tropicibacter naphthalenivorans]SMC96993.1 multisubunit potassium/proton antiporter, PhaD subunit [Tropicibacter naphthalenivorans]